MTATVTRSDMFRAVYVATVRLHDPLPTPRQFKEAEKVREGKPRLLVLRFDARADAAQWARYLGFEATAAEHSGLITISVSYEGAWLGWQVYLLADEVGRQPTVEEVATALVVAT